MEAHILSSSMCQDVHNLKMLKLIHKSWMLGLRCVFTVGMHGAFFNIMSQSFNCFMVTSFCVSYHCTTPISIWPSLPIEILADISKRPCRQVQLQTSVVSSYSTTFWLSGLLMKTISSSVWLDIANTDIWALILLLFSCMFFCGMICTLGEPLACLNLIGHPILH